MIVTIFSLFLRVCVYPCCAGTSVGCWRRCCLETQTWVYGGSLVGLVHHALSLLHPYLLLAAAPPTGEPIIAPRPDPDSLLILSQHCDLLTHVFIHEAVGGGQSVLKIGWRQGNLLLAGVMHLSFFWGGISGSSGSFSIHWQDKTWWLKKKKTR